MTERISNGSQEQENPNMFVFHIPYTTEKVVIDAPRLRNIAYREVKALEIASKLRINPAHTYVFSMDIPKNVSGLGGFKFFFTRTPGPTNTIEFGHPSEARIQYLMRLEKIRGAKERAGTN